MIRNKDNKWIDSSVFRKEAINFQKTGIYTAAIYGTPDWIDYWQTQLSRCIEGFEIQGEKITGHHYFYLNFTQIQIAEVDENDATIAKKVTKNPDFWDGDYDYFWCLEIAEKGLFNTSSQVATSDKEKKQYKELSFLLKELVKADKKDTDEYIKIKAQRDELCLKVLNRIGLRVKPHLDYLDGGNHMIVGKSRRKGYSYKNGSICANIYNSIRKAKVVVGAFEKKYYEPIIAMAFDYLNFLNESTGWAKARDSVNRKDHVKASYKTTEQGIEVEKGYKSEIFALSFMDKPDAARGTDIKLVLFEEAGVFPNLKAAFNATTPALTAGIYITGLIVIFGTGGDMSSGTVDYADMFYNPIGFGLMPFMNIWDKDAENTVCGFFHPVTLNMEGFYDAQGNSNVKGAEEFELQRRDKILKNSSSSTVLQNHVQEYPFSPSEAFLTVSTNNFPVLELRNQLNKVTVEKLQLKKGTCVTLERVEGKVTAKPDLKNLLTPIINYNPKLADLSGCPIVYEYPIDNAPKGLYKIGYDPYRQDLSQGVSLAAIYVYKGVYKGSFSKNIIVAEYVGRPKEADDVNRTASLLAELYNAEIMHENEVTHVKNYFRKIKRLDQLAAQPDVVISKNVKNSTVARVYGIHMVDKLKDAGEKYIKDWLLEVKDYDEHGNPILNLDSIYSIGLLEELIAYSRKINADRVMAFMMCMFFVQEDELGKEYNKETVSNAKSIYDMLDKIYKN